MDGNLAYAREHWNDQSPSQVIDGKVVMMSPSPAINHGTIADNILEIFRNYLRGKTCVPFGDNRDVHLTENQTYIPDGMVVCDRDKIRFDGVYGAPDLVYEVLSPSTARFDRGRKMEVYAQCGVREYWIVSPAEKLVEQYLLQDGRFRIQAVCAYYPDWMLAPMRPEDRAEAEAQMRFRCGIFPELELHAEDIFGNLLF